MSDIPWLFEQQRIGIKAGLTRVQALLGRLGDPQASFRTVLVAGTNGKGSTASTLASILSERQTVGLFTSPHLTYFGERFVVNGKRLSTTTIEDALARVKPHAIATGATFFEIVTALACLLFAEADVRWAVMECGMGGRNDATNVLTPELSLITNIALDHMKVLGDTVQEIAKDKAGIMRSGRVCLTTAEAKGLEVLRQEAEMVGARLRILEMASPSFEEKIDDISSLMAHSMKTDLPSRQSAKAYHVLKSDWRGVLLSIGNLTVQSSLIGTFQAANVALAVATAQELGVADDAIRVGVQTTVWPGRLERIQYKGKTFLLDGAHNPAAASVLAKTLADLPHGEITLLFGAMQDKDIDGVLEVLRPLGKRTVFTLAQLNPRAEDPDRLAERYAGEVIPDIHKALARALELTPPDGLILVAGSLYLIGELRPLLLGETGEGLERWQ